jgi:hypothetical protein
VPRPPVRAAWSPTWCSSWRCPWAGIPFLRIVPRDEAAGGGTAVGLPREATRRMLAVFRYVLAQYCRFDAGLAWRVLRLWHEQGWPAGGRCHGLSRDISCSHADGWAPPWTGRIEVGRTTDELNDLQRHMEIGSPSRSDADPCHRPSPMWHLPAVRPRWAAWMPTFSFAVRRCWAVWEGRCCYDSGTCVRLPPGLPLDATPPRAWRETWRLRSGCQTNDILGGPRGTRTAQAV